jgi:DnaJ-class molecular chaperone
MVADSKYYDLLGVTPKASEDDIKKVFSAQSTRFSLCTFQMLQQQAYKQMAKKYHPDRNPNADPEKVSVCVFV